MPDAAASLLDQVRRLDGVREVERAGPQVTVRGSRPVIAHVGAALVRWGPVPADLSVHVPSLEDALLGLLDGATSGEAVADEHGLTGHRVTEHGATEHGELVGGRR
jgi:hypothetical protein